MILGSFFGGRFPWRLLGSWVGAAWPCCALRFGIGGPMECLLGVSCRGLKRYKNKGFALFGWEEGWPKGGPGSVQEGLSWARESDQKKPRRVQVENANILQK